ncbi:MAG: NAD(P)/FAD-dependent oxidoreductase [Bacteroidales bacterium]|nr:NAD(P)/FAD-dependent oxidoreductase [Candidatus Sodaliphilus aphodohippi]
MITAADNKTIVVVGAGPAGLTAAYTLLQQKGYHVVVVEECPQVGGIAKTLNHNGNLMDIGGHRFFTKVDEVNDFWNKIMPIQGKPSSDDIALGTAKEFAAGGPDPQESDRVMLVRNRVSRILYSQHFFDYPVSLSISTLRSMGLLNTIKVGVGYLCAMLRHREEKSLEDFYINRFGKPLYNMFFENYTQKVWGVHPSNIGADWGRQRVKGLSIVAIFKDILSRTFVPRSKRHVETSLIDRFTYPKYGPGQLWEYLADDIKSLGGEIRLNCCVQEINISDGNAVKSVVVRNEDGSLQTIDCDYLLSSMPLRDLFNGIKGIQVPDNVLHAAQGLPYRDFITVGVLVNRLKFVNKTKIKTYGNRIPDTWLYIQEPHVKVGRLQLFNNWSPYLVKDNENTMWIGMEYFCTEGDTMWNTPDDKFITMAADELVKIGAIESVDDVLDSTVYKIKKAYPAYFGTYGQLDEVRGFLDGITNLYCIGRNGQHRYNNMDHSMLTAMRAADAIIEGRDGRDMVWSVNTEQEYHESK